MSHVRATEAQKQAVREANANFSKPKPTIYEDEEDVWSDDDEAVLQAYYAFHESTKKKDITVLQFLGGLIGGYILIFLFAVMISPH